MLHIWKKIMMIKMNVNITEKVFLKYSIINKKNGNFKILQEIWTDKYLMTKKEVFLGLKSNK